MTRRRLPIPYQWYRGRGEPSHLTGVEFSRDTRNLAACEVAEA